MTMDHNRLRHVAADAPMPGEVSGLEVQDMAQELLEARKLVKQHDTAAQAVEAQLNFLRRENEELRSEECMARLERRVMAAEARADAAILIVERFKAPYANVKRQADANSHDYARGHANGKVHALDEVLEALRAAQMTGGDGR